MEDTTSKEYPWGRTRLRENEPFISILRRGDIKYAVVQEKGNFANRLGTFAYEDIKGKPFGTQWVSRVDRQQSGRGHQRKKRKMGAEAAASSTAATGPEEEEEKMGTGDAADIQKETAALEAASGKQRAKIHVLQCTPELWCRSLLHRTQIIYGLDASLICFHLDLIPGKVVVESGTGSGSLTLAMSRAVAPDGRINTYEFNESRVEAAKNDIKLLGIEDLVTVRHCDAYDEQGFVGVVGQADAVFLDLPKPWKALHNCVRALKTDVETRLCSFSPCIEQVQKTCDALRELGFFQIRTFECLFREFETYRLQERIPKMWEDTHNANELKTTFNPAVRSGSTCVFPEMATHTGYLTFCTRFPLIEPKSSSSSSSTTTSS